MLAGVEADVLIVSVEVPAPLATEVGLNEHVGAVTTTGAMLQVRATALLKAFSAATVIVDVPAPPTVTLAGATADAAMVKSGAALTFRVTSAL